MIGAVLAARAAVSKALGSVPWQIWAVVAALALVGLGSCVHARKVKAFGNERYAAGVADMKKAFDKAHAAALVYKAKSEARSAAITTEIRGKHEATLRDNSARADDLRLRGPGAARCRSVDNPGVSSSSGGREQAAPVADAAGPGVPSGDWASVPWAWAVTRAQEHDACLSESKTWREWHERQSTR